MFGPFATAAIWHDLQATRKQISDAYKKIALQCHPDRCKDPNQASELTKYFDECTQAYDALCDPVTRALYDLVIGVTEDTPEEVRLGGIVPLRRGTMALQLGWLSS